MKIYILPTDCKFQPDSQIFRYPAHNNDYGVEQDFFTYLMRNKELITEKPEEADWHYLPIFWTRWHLNHDYARAGLEELQNEANRLVIDDEKTFTICQYDDGPVANLGKTIIFFASRKTSYGLDIPLLSSPHKLPFFKPRKKYLASFIGRLSTHPIRRKMADKLSHRKDTFLDDGDKGNNFFVKKILESYIALCPRGYGGSSFRFFEAMQLGAVPFLIGDIDTRPFKKFIKWDEYSLFSDNVDDIAYKLEMHSTEELLRMASRSTQLHHDSLRFGLWCKYVIKELEEL